MGMSALKLYLLQSVTGASHPGRTPLPLAMNALKLHLHETVGFSLLLLLATQYIHPKLQALVYDILPSTTAVFSYAIGLSKLSANEQFFVGAQTVVSLLQTTQIISDVYLKQFAYASSNKTHNRLNRDRTLFFFSLFLPGVDAPRVYVRAWALGCFHSTRNFRRALTASVDSCAEIKSAPSVA